jgi:hypothetical protein
VRNHTVSIPDSQTFRFDVNASGRIDSGDVTRLAPAILALMSAVPLTHKATILSDLWAAPPDLSAEAIKLA